MEDSDSYDSNSNQCSERVTFIKKKRERRSKEDFSDWNFVCGCKK